MGNMRPRVVITAPFATPEETARTYGISKRRARELRKMVEESLAKKGYHFLNEEGSAAGRNGANTRVKSKSGNASRRKTTRAKAKSSR
jgi:hypothetical protein